MHPLLFSIGPIKIYSYGVMLFLAFIVALHIAKKLACSNGIDPKQYEDIAICGLIVGLLGAKFFYLLTRVNEIFKDPQIISSYITSGFVFYGAPLAVIPYLILAKKKYNFSVLKYLDIFMVVLPLGHAIGRIGCFLAGCCYGKPTTLPWGIILNSDMQPPYLHNVHLHPVQLYESFLLFLLFLFLYKTYKKKSFIGETFSLYFIIYSVIRFIMEYFRGDDIRGFIIENIISTSQFISILTFLMGVCCFIYFRGNYGKFNEKN